MNHFYFALPKKIFLITPIVLLTVGIIFFVSFSSQLRFVFAKDNVVPTPPTAIVIKFKPSQIKLQTTLGKIKSYLFLRHYHLHSLTTLPRDNILLLKVDDRRSVSAIMTELKQDSDISYIQPNYHYYPLATPNDPDFSHLWGLNNTGQNANGVTGLSGADIKATEAWDLENPAWPTTSIAVIDSGLLPIDNDLKNNLDLTNSFDFTTNQAIDPLSFDYGNSHGTQVAKVIAAEANNQLGGTGLSFFNKLKIMYLKTDYTTAQIISAINYAQDHGAKIINASWGCTSDSQSDYACSPADKDYQDTALNEAIAAFPGLVMTAAGNGFQENGTGQNHDDPNGFHVYPCDFNLTNIICVAAADQNDNLAPFSDYGMASVDVAAPGQNIYTFDPRSMSNSFLEKFDLVTPPEIGLQLTKEGDDNNWGTVKMDSINALWSDYLNFPYHSSTNSAVVSSEIDLSSSTMIDSELYFQIACDTEPRTSAWKDYVILSLYDGNNWIEAARYDETALGDELFHPISVDLKSYQNAHFRFRLTWIADDQNNDHLGCAIWPFQVQTFDSNYLSTYSQGTSLAAAYVSGLAGLIWSANPTLSSNQVRDIILTTGDSPESLAGKVATGKRINFYEALYSTPAPRSVSRSTHTPTPTPTPTSTPTSEIQTIVEPALEETPTPNPSQSGSPNITSSPTAIALASPVPSASAKTSPQISTSPSASPSLLTSPQFKNLLKWLLIIGLPITLGLGGFIFYQKR